MPEPRERPEIYGGADDPYEAVKVIRAWDLPYVLGNVLKNIKAASKLPDEEAIEKLRTAWT